MPLATVVSTILKIYSPPNNAKIKATDVSTAKLLSLSQISNIHCRIKTIRNSATAATADRT